jgi:hypothetical protein
MEYAKCFCGNEKADGDLSADSWATAVIKVSCILIIGVVILSNVVIATNITASSPFYILMNSVTGNINSGYQLAALMVLAISAGSILHFLGFM